MNNFLTGLFPTGHRLGWVGLAWVLCHINHCYLFNAKYFLYINDQIVLFQTIQFSTSTVSMSKTVLFQIIQFSISTYFSFIWPIDRISSGATTPGQERTWEQWQRRGTPYSPKFQYYWNLTIRLFSILSRTLIGVCKWGDLSTLQRSC